MYINLELYRTFYTTAKLGSISKAAKELFTSQPAVSHSIKLLEEKLGGQLFYRTPRGVELTLEGKVLFEYVEQGYGIIQKGERKFQELKNLTFGEVRIAACNAACKYFLLEHLKKYNKLYPNIKINVTNESSYRILELLECGEIDIGILNMDINKKDSLSIIKTLDLQDCFVVNEKYKHLSKTQIFLSKLIESSPILLLEKGGNSRDRIDNYFNSHGVSLSPEIELSTVELLVEFAKIGLGAACVVKNYIEKELEEKQLYEVKLKETIPKRIIGVATKKGISMSTAAEKFIELIES
ncbi:LysR family transcriptional regulator [Clostridium sp.]|uniref:LysR family transcriptional regulator n=1 Tax=Clostridium sp. TaxID=1506 RepID=UPI003463C019